MPCGIIALMDGGVPTTLGSQLLLLARNDPASEVRRVAIYALSAISNPGAEVNEYWIQSLKDAANTGLRGMVLNAFRINAPSDPAVISQLKR
jgi:hypothetical protein